VRADIAAMDGYTPGEQPGAGERVVKLNTNENPYPPSPKVIAAVQNVEGELLRRYPDPVGNLFRDAAAKKWGLSREHLLCGNGSDDLLTIATRACVPAGGVLGYATPTYSLYSVLAGLQGAKVAEVAWGEGYALPVEALVASGADAIYVANPNAPTGTYTPPQQIAELAKAFKGLVLVDEAYADFAEGNCMGLVKEGVRNIVVTRTMSKSYSLAGMRFGYLAGQPEVVAELMKVKDSYNADAISVIAATAAIEDEEYARGIWELVRSERARLTTELTKLGYAVIPSQANFVLAGVPGGGAKAIYQRLKQQGILVRYFDRPGLSDKIRITVGTSNENNALLAGIKGMSAGEKAA
jgi:histidinol-phosphate aminotransferase